MEDENVVQVIATNIYGDVCLRKARRKRQKLLITELFYDFATNTTLNGIPYITKKGLTMAERIFWAIAFIISLCWCSVLIYQLWFRWKTSPVIVTISEEVVSVGMVPFPSVTICPQWKCKASVYNYTYESSQLKKLYNRSWHYETNSSLYHRISKWNDIYSICNDYDEFIQIGRNITNSSMIEHMYEVSPDAKDLFDSCQLTREDNMGCEYTFRKVLTQEGVCFTANSMAYNEIFRKNKVQEEYKYLYEDRPSRGWSIAEGYDFSESYPYPVHGIENGEIPDLTVILRENITDRDPKCKVFNSGFKVYIHHPSDLPQSSLHYYAVLDNQVSSIALSFSILNTSESLRPYGPETRQCYFPDERYLKYFRNYTANNCWMECKSNYTFEKCGCVDFYMPHNNSDQICAEDKYECITIAQGELVRKESESQNGCHCLPACISVDYEAEILKTDFNVDKWFTTQDMGEYGSSLLKDIKFSKIEMYYKRPRFLSMRRSELFGVTEFIANCGGLLGLFMGFSFMSLIEIIFYLTLRLCCILKKDLEEEKKQANIEKQDRKRKF